MLIALRLLLAFFGRFSWHKGSVRSVLVVRGLGIVFKFPRIFLKAFIVNTRHYAEYGIFWKYWREWTVDMQLTPKHALFKGIADNWREYRYCRRKSSELSILLPTYCSLFGLINIQKVARNSCAAFDRHDSGWWHQMYEITDGYAHKDGHHFANPNNFCIEDGKIRILDYGSPKTRKVLNRCGRDIYEKFDVNYVFPGRDKV